MKIATMQRLSQIDEEKIGIDLMKFSIKSASNFSSHLYFLQMGEISQEIIDFIYSLGKIIKIKKSNIDYGSGWGFKNNESLDELYQIIDEKFDWILYPDMDTILPENIPQILQEAEDKQSDVIRFHYIECIRSEMEIILISDGFPIGPHFAILKPVNDLKFIGSRGFCEPVMGDRDLKRYETDYCMRHLRYASQSSVEKRKNMNYYQDYFLQNHPTIEYKPNQLINYYRK